MFNGCGVMCVFRDGTYCAALFLTSQRILGTLIKVNRLPFISESCSTGSKLPKYKFSLRKSEYLLCFK